MPKEYDSVDELIQICSVVIKRDDTYLLVQEAKAKAYKLWSLPGGHLEKGESLEQAAIREAKEETGYSVKLVKKVFVYEKKEPERIFHTYMAEILGGELVFPKAEILDARWFSLRDILTKKDLRDPEFLVPAIQAAST
jgi:8-oxo-dGTP diphosphatase